MSLKKLREQLAAGEVAFQERVSEGIPLYAGPMVIRRADCDAMAWAAGEIERLRGIVEKVRSYANHAPIDIKDAKDIQADLLDITKAEAGKDGA